MKLTIRQVLSRKPKMKLKSIQRRFAELRDERLPSYVPGAIIDDIVNGRAVFWLDTSVYPLSKISNKPRGWKKGRPRKINLSNNQIVTKKSKNKCK